MEPTNRRDRIAYMIGYSLIIEHFKIDGKIAKIVNRNMHIS